MNGTQKIVRILGVLLLVLMVLVPPWKLTFTSLPHHTPGSHSLGYHTLGYHFEPPSDDSQTDLQQRIDLIRLGCQLAGVLILTNGALALLKTSKN